MVSDFVNSYYPNEDAYCLNPCCNGRWSLTSRVMNNVEIFKESLNPCCNGRWSLTTQTRTMTMSTNMRVLILKTLESVLILVVMEDGLWQGREIPIRKGVLSLNPCCNGRWSLTAKLKNLGFIGVLRPSNSDFLTFRPKKWCFETGCKITKKVQYVKEQFS